MTVEIPDKAEHRAAWASLAMADRRRIMRTITRGVAVDHRRDAALAIGAAQQQKFFWKWAWGLGPMLGLVLIGQPWIQIAVNVVLSTGLIVALSRWRWVRADRSQRANIELLEGPKKSTPKGNRRTKGHLPGEAAAAGQSQSRRGPAPTPADWSGDRPDPGTSRAKLQRRKKRR